MMLIPIVVILLAWYILKEYEKKKRAYKLLAKFPGPKGYPLIGNTLSIIGSSVDYIKRLDRWALEYEFPFCLWILNRPTVISARSEDIAAVFNQPAALNRGGMIKKLGKPLFGNSLFIADYPEWKTRRKIIATTFKPKIIENFFHIFQQNCDLLVSQFRTVSKEGEGSIDLNEFVPQITFRTLCGTAMGTDLENLSLSTSYYRDYIKAINDFLKISSLRALNFWQQIDWIYWFSNSKKRLDQAINVAQDFSMQILLRKRRKILEESDCFNNNETEFSRLNSSQKVFIDFLVELSHKDDSFREKDIRGEVDTFTVAGYETTAITTCFSLLLLGIHQDCQKKLFEEIQTILPDPQKPIEYRDIEKMGYLDRFLKEVLRKWGPAVVLSRSLKDDIKLDDTYTIPKGANFVFWIRSLHYNPKIWPEPDKFDPDRFLPENIAKRPPNTYIPFSTGSRNCIGMKYAQILLKTVILSMVRNFRITSDMKEIDIEIEYAFTIRSKNGYWVKLEERQY